MSTTGFSRTRLDRMHDTMAKFVENEGVPGLVTLVSRGDEVHVDAHGTFAYGDATPMRRDTIFRIASMSKPIAAAAAMILVERCQLRLDDPVDTWLPELADRQVLRTIESPLDDTVPAQRPITLRDLLTFRLGLGAIMEYPEKHPIQIAMRDAGVAPGPNMPMFSPDEMIRKLGNLPLAYQPGEHWLYNTGSDVLGVLIARVTGRSFGTFLEEEIFAPLGMKDTGFSVPPEKADRLPAAYWNVDGKREIFDEAHTGSFARPPIFESGAGGLVSTADDYLTFCRMMLHGGTYQGQRILARPTVTLMTTDQMTPEQKAVSHFVPGFWDNRGWGLGMAIVTRRIELSDSPGRFGWDGGHGTSAYSDPQEDVIGIMLSQRVVDSPIAGALYSDFWTSVYQALDA